MTNNDKLRDYILWSIEAYNVAADPPALNYSKHVDVLQKDDVNVYSRMFLLMHSIDVKYALYKHLAALPRKRANVLMGWITRDEEYYFHHLTYRQQTHLKQDRNELKKLLLLGHTESPKSLVVDTQYD